MDDTATLVDSLRRQGERVWDVLPDIGLALLLLALGWLFARVARKAVIRLLRALRVDEGAERAGIEDFLIQGGVQ